GLPADHRPDIFSLGAMLYEMLSGRHPFRRTTTADTIGAILRDEASAFPDAAAVPPALEHIVRHCLEKEPADRFQSMRDLAFALETPLSGLSSPSSPVRHSAWTTARRAALILLAIAAAAAAGAMVAF